VSVKMIFAANLKRLCGTQKSHAQVARDLGINRQQFNGYVTGRNLPNEGIIDRICTYFGVKLDVLFRDWTPEEEFSSLEILTNNQKQIISLFALHERSLSRSNISKGLYYIYFEFPGEPDNLVCSLFAVGREGILTTFRRITRMKCGSGLQLLGANGVHKGIVLKRSNTLFMLALDSIDDWLPSLLVAEANSSSSVLYSGFAQIMSPSKFHTVKFCIVPITSNLNIPSLMRQVRIQSKNEIFNTSNIVYRFFYN
jgi:transcriptional regulator with XRE-family HTH domain